ncbi:putative Phosphoglycerate mutase [Seiridium cardinale]|uniref:Phosphoglycerate mutase n=1 Tax=Seiridium cardinale TaxID=138064 RepID=A0ABR2XIF7_9PEZI
MPPQIILIRHGQALHNIDDNWSNIPVHDWNIGDPALTTKGEAQCKQLALDLQYKHSFPREETLIVVSPLRRTLQSYQHGLGWLAEEGVRVELRAEWQETTGNPCDIGSEVAAIEKEWPHLDFSQLDPVYPTKTGLYDPSEEALLHRAKIAREWLYHRSEKHVIVMTHSGFIRRVAPDGTKYANAEYRTYDFAQEDEKDGPRQFKLIEREQVHQSLETQQPSLK